MGAGETPLGAFDEAMGDVGTWATKLRAALDDTKKWADSQTWVGPYADTWNTAFLDQYNKITALLARISPGGDEYKVLQAQAQAAQTSFNHRTVVAD
jgi:hypothetical protein